MKTRILADFQICINVPLRERKSDDDVSDFEIVILDSTKRTK